MRFDTFNIPAYGPFTNFKLDLPSSDSDIHLIHGANETGKTSLLRAFEHFLYGMPPRSTDAFLHANSQLLIRATLSHDGQTLTALRRTGRNNSLIDTQSTPVDAERFAAFTGNVRKEFFNNMLGLNTRQLRDGSAELLSGKSEISHLLFSASYSGGNITKAKEKLQAEAASLAQGRATKNVRIAEAIASYKACKEAEKTQTFPVAQWQALKQDLSNKQGEFDTLDQTRNQEYIRAQFVTAVLNSLPLIRQRAEILEALEAITLPALADDFPEMVRHWQLQLSNANAGIGPQRQQLDKLRVTFAESPDPTEHLANSGEIEAIHRQVARYQSDGADLESLRQDNQRETARLTADLERNGIASIDELMHRPCATSAQLDELEETREQLESAGATVAQLTVRHEESARSLEQKQQQLDNLSQAEFPARLAALLKDANAHETRIERLGELRLSLQSLQRTNTSLAEDLFYPSETIREFEVPLRQQMESLIESHNEITTEQKEQCRQQRALENAIERLNLEIEQLRGNREIATRESLDLSRGQRDTAWKPIKSKALKGNPVSKDVISRFSTLMEKSDELADQLIEDAETMAKAAEKNLELERKTLELSQITDEIERLDQQLEEWQDEWTELTSFQKEYDLDMDYLSDWMNTYEEWQENEEEIATATDRLARLESQVEAFTADLRTALAREDADAETLIIELQRMKSAADESRGEGRTLTSDVDKLTRQRDQLSRELEEARTIATAAGERWSRLTAEHPTAAASSPRAAVAQLRLIAELQSRASQIAVNTQRIDSLQQRVDAFTDDLSQIFTRILPESEITDPIRRESELWRLLTTARKQNTQRDNQRQTIDEIESRLADLEAKKRQATDELQSFVTRANGENIDALDSCIQQFGERKELQRRLNELEGNLLTQAGGENLQSFIERCLGENPDALNLEQATSKTKLADLQQKRDAALGELRMLEARKSTMENSVNEAAESLQKAQNALSLIVTDTERFIRLHHAIDFLNAQIEAFREKAQGPLVEKTSSYFRTLTEGAYEGVAARQNDNGSINLVALRPSGRDDQPAQEITTSELSEGTGDQLFLSLRLAAIEHHFENHQPMPLILDDVLMTFDDRRSAALFKALEPLSKITQILIFTHHSHLAQVAEESPVNIICHSLARLDLTNNQPASDDVVPGRGRGGSVAIKGLSVN